MTIGLVLRRQAKRPARELLNEGDAGEFAIQNQQSKKRVWAKWIGAGSGAAAVATLIWALAERGGASPEVFFSADRCWLICRGLRERPLF